MNNLIIFLEIKSNRLIDKISLSKNLIIDKSSDIIL
jgi:hypothetical protein